MNKVFYFSATGNSLFAAKRIAAELPGEAESILNYGGEKVEAERIVIVSPVHAFGLPAFTADFIRGLDTPSPVWIVLTYGGALMGAERTAYAQAKEAGLDIRAVFTVKMVENFTVFVPVPRGFGRNALKKAPARIAGVTQRIKENAAFEPKRKNGGRPDSADMRSGWNNMGRRFSVTEDCVGCGKCARICPAGNITMNNGRPEFGESCTGCLACYHRCPKKAIRYGKFKFKFRYFCPLADEKELESRS